MPKQPAFPSLRHSMKKKQTRREKFLSEMDAVVPWPRLLALIGPHYPRVGPKGGRPPMPLETMLRIYFLQNWYALSDPMAEEMLYDSDAMRQFAGIELGDDCIPDETTILNFRHLLETHQLTEKLFVEVNTHLVRHGITLRSGTLVDATIIDAPSSTKNEAKVRDPEMSSTKKGNNWYFGIKAHVGVDAASGIVHSLDTTMAKTHDSQVWETPVAPAGLSNLQPTHKSTSICHSSLQQKHWRMYPANQRSPEYIKSMGGRRRLRFSRKRLNLMNSGHPTKSKRHDMSFLFHEWTLTYCYYCGRVLVSKLDYRFIRGL